LPLTIYREDFYFVDWVHGSALLGNWCTTGCEAHMNFACESACLKADNVWNEVVTIHRTQEELKMLSLYMHIFSAINCFIKKHRYNNPSFLHLQSTRHQLPLDGAGLHGLVVDSVNSSSNYFAYLCFPASETTLHHKRMSTVFDLTLDYRLQKPAAKMNPVS
jgi:hypothetical protein